MIIHICGASGSGKTYLGNILKQKFKSKIVMCDLDDLRNNFISGCLKANMSYVKFVRNYAKNYQLVLDKFIEKNKNKPIIFVGINTYINGETYGYRGKDYKPKLFLDTRADYKFYIKVSTNIIIKQRWNREYNDFMNRFYDYMIREKNNIYDQIIHDEKKAKKDVIDYVTDIMNFERTKKHIKKCNNFYKKNKYEFMTSYDIYKKSANIIKSF
jgi:adenylate kinase family enzyme